MAIGSQHTVITQKQGDGSYRTYFGFDIPENAFRNGIIDLTDAEATRELLLSTDHFGDWDQHYHQLIRHATDFRGWPLYSLEKEALGWKAVSGVTLAGDAAHLSIPGGNGVNLALNDSFELAMKIKQHGMDDIDRAVREYETAMFERGVMSIQQGLMMAKVQKDESPKAFLELIQGLDRGPEES